MAKQARHSTGKDGIYWVEAVSASGRPDRIYYSRFRKNGKLIEDKEGFASHGMTAAKASRRRALKIERKMSTNAEKRATEKAEQEKAKDKKWTIENLWQEYKKQNPHLKGWRTYNSAYKVHIKEPFGQKEPHEILPLDVDRIRLKLLKKKSPQTVSHVLKQLVRIVNFGYEKRLCRRLDFNVKLPRVDNKKTEDLSEKQLKRLITVIEADSHSQAGPLMLMALFTGMRRGEMFKLKWKDVDFERGFIHILDPKGGPDQIIPLNDKARKLLKKHPKVKGSQYVFPGSKGRQLVNCDKPLRAIAKAAKLPKGFRPLHGLRHVYASMLASSGQVDMYTLQKLLTHSDPTMTQRYAHLRDEALKRASNVAGDIIEKTMNGD